MNCFLLDSTAPVVSELVEKTCEAQGACAVRIQECGSGELCADKCGKTVCRKRQRMCRQCRHTGCTCSVSSVNKRGRKTYRCTDCSPADCDADYKPKRFFDFARVRRPLVEVGKLYYTIIITAGT